MRFEKKAGMRAMIGVGEDQDKILIATDRITPRDITLPKALGGRIVEVVRGRAAGCPQCHRTAWHLDLVNGISVAECPCAGFLWYRDTNVSTEKEMATEEAVVSWGDL